MSKMLLPDSSWQTDPETGEKAYIRNFTDSKYDWPEGLLQGGENGVVVSPKGNYKTSFVEIFVDNTFIRGEGETLEEAETDCWNKYQDRNLCPGHEWEPRGLKNGGGYCKNCNIFGMNVISIEEVGEHCAVCGKATFYHFSHKTNLYYCEEDYPLKVEQARYFELLKNRSWDLPADEQEAFNKELNELYRIVFELD